MTEKKKNSLWDNKLSLSLLSLLMALFLWLYVTGTDGVEVTREYRNVKVQFIGVEELQESSGLIVTDQDVNTVDLTLSGLRRTLGKISEKDLSVTVDLRSVTTTGHYTMLYQVAYPEDISGDDITVVGSEPNTVYITVDRLTSRKVEVKGSFSGTTAEGYMADDMLAFDPMTVKVSGPQSLVEQVDCAWVSITREGVDSTLSYMTSYTLLDAEGNAIDPAPLTLETEEVNVTLNVLMTKTVALTAARIPGGGATEENTVLTVEPKSITLAGSPETLDSVNQIVVDTIKLANVNSVYESEGLLIPIPNDTVNLSGVTMASVHLEIQNLATKTFNLDNDAVIFTNVPEGFDAECITEIVPVLVRSSGEDVESISEGNIRLVVDLTDCTASAGIINLPVKVNVDGHADAGAVGEYKVYVRLSAR